MRSNPTWLLSQRKVDTTNQFRLKRGWILYCSLRTILRLVITANPTLVLSQSIVDSTLKQDFIII